MSRSRLRAEALDRNDSFQFANVTIDGYSGEELNEGYQTGLVFTNGPLGPTTLTFAAADGAITQAGSGQVLFNGEVRANSNLRVLGNSVLDGYLYAYGNVVLGNNLVGDTLDITATIISDLVPQDAAYQLGTPTDRWLDGYFDLFSPTYYTPIGSNYSLEGHLKGIDAALAGVAGFKHGTYIVTAAEDTSDTVDSSRAVDQGIQTDVGSYTDTQFRDSIYIFLDGQLLLNDTAKRANNAAVVNDVARDTVNASLLRFSRNIKKGSILQIVINV